MKRALEKLGKYAVYGIGFALLATMVLSCKYKYKEIGPYKEGLAPAQLRDGKWGFIDEKKNEVIPFKYDAVETFNNGFAIVVKGKGEYGVIDKSGKEVLPCRYDNVERFFDGTGSISTKWKIIESNGKYGIFDLEKEKELLPPKYNKIDGTFYKQDSLIMVRMGSKCGFVNADGKEVIPFKYDDAFVIDGMVRVILNDKYGVVDKTGKEVVAPKYEDIGKFNKNNFAQVKLNGKFGIIHITGKEIIPPTYDMPFGFKLEGEGWDNLTDVKDMKAKIMAAIQDSKANQSNSKANQSNSKTRTLRFANYNPVRFADTQTGKVLVYRTLILNGSEVTSKPKLVNEQGTDMVQFVLVASKLTGTRQEGSTTVSTYSGSKTVAYSLGTTFEYELANGVLTITK